LIEQVDVKHTITTKLPPQITNTRISETKDQSAYTEHKY